MKIISVQSKGDRLITITELDDGGIRINYKVINTSKRKFESHGIHWPVPHKESYAIELAIEWLEGAK
jgi:hypothetical protein